MAWTGPIESYTTTLCGQEWWQGHFQMIAENFHTLRKASCSGSWSTCVSLLEYIVSIPHHNIRWCKPISVVFLNLISHYYFGAFSWFGLKRQGSQLESLDRYAWYLSNMNEYSRIPHNLTTTHTHLHTHYHFHFVYVIESGSHLLFLFIWICGGKEINRLF